MPAAVKSEPDRPFQLALRSTRALGMMSTGAGLVVLVVWGYFNRLPQFRLAFELLATIVLLLPGVAFVVAAIMMKERRRWAVIVAMCACAAQLLMAIAAFVANFIFPPMSLVPIVVSAAWVAALIQLLMHLKQSLGVLNFVPETGSHGFEIISREPVAAIPIENQSIESDLPK